MYNRRIKVEISLRYEDIDRISGSLMMVDVEITPRLIRIKLFC